MPSLVIAFGPHLETVHISARHESDEQLESLRRWLGTRPAELLLFYEALKLTRSPFARALADRLEPLPNTTSDDNLSDPPADV